MVVLVKDTEAPKPDPVYVTGVKFAAFGGAETGAPTVTVGKAMAGGANEVVGEHVIGSATQMVVAVVAAFTTDGAFVGGWMTSSRQL